MATYTTNYNLKKPASSDTVDIADINGNMDTIDTTMKSLSDNKLAKVTSTDGYNRLYGVDTTGAQQVVPYSSGAYANTLVYRTTDGKTSVGTPTADAHATTKKYVDDGLKTKISTVKVNSTALTPDSSYAVNITVPTALSGLSDDSTHRVVTDTEKSTWNGKQSAMTFTDVTVTESG